MASSTSPGIGAFGQDWSPSIAKDELRAVELSHLDCERRQEERSAWDARSTT